MYYDVADVQSVLAQVSVDNNTSLNKLPQSLL